MKIEVVNVSQSEDNVELGKNLVQEGEFEKAESMLKKAFKGDIKSFFDRDAFSVGEVFQFFKVSNANDESGSSPIVGKTSLNAVCFSRKFFPATSGFNGNNAESFTFRFNIEIIQDNHFLQNDYQFTQYKIFSLICQ